MTTFLPRRSVCFLVFSTALLLAPAVASRADYVTLSLQSQPGDFIGQGQTFNFTYTPANSQSFFVNTLRDSNGQPNYVEFIVGTVTSSNSTNTYSELTFATNHLGIPLQVGTYTNAQRAAFASSGHPGLDVSFQNRGSNTLTGQFTINSISFYTDLSNQIQIGSFDVNFEQHSEGATPALFGHLVFQSTAAVPEPSSLLLLSAGATFLVGMRRFWRVRAA